MAAKIFRINYKSDFILTLTSDAGWMTPFCIKFFTGSPMLAYYASWDGETYTHCAPVAGEPTKLLVQFDDHHLPIGDLKFQIAYHFTVADFPNDTEDEVLNQANITTEIDGETYQVMLDFTGETAPEIEFSLPAYANEAQRIENEQQRIANEEQRIAAETVRIQNEQQRIAQEQTRQRNEQQRINQEQARVEEYAGLKADAVAATGAANDAAALANQKAQLAADKAALAGAAATLANAKAQLAADKAALAESAATLANQKAALAQQKAEYAQEQGTYSKNQGDYAKEQGDYSKAQGDYAKDQGDYSKSKGDYAKDQGDYSKQQGDYAKEQGEICAADHLVAVEDHQTAAADHQTAASDHQTATADHTQAGNDHTRAESDHTRAESDHAAVEVYVDSLGAFDISSYHATGGELAKYADLTAALGNGAANIPEAIRKGGMSVKFVQSSDNKYVQFRCMAQSFTTDTTQWAICDNGVYIENPEYIRVYTDKDGKILWAIKTDGDIYYGAGCPQQVIDYIEKKIADLSLDEYEDIVAFLSDYLGSDTTLKVMIDSINAQISEKVDKEEGKSLIDEEYAEGVHYIENSEFVEIKLDKDDRIIEATTLDGTKLLPSGVKINKKIDFKGNETTIIENPEFVEVSLDSAGHILWGIQKNGNVYFGYGVPSQIVEYVSSHVAEIQAELATKVDKIDGKGLSTCDYTPTEKEIVNTVSTIENPEYIKAETDADGKTLAGRKKDGTWEEKIGLITPSINIDNTSVKNIDDFKERISIITDSNDKEISYREKDGRLVENAGVKTTDIEAEKLTVDEIITSNVTVTDKIDKIKVYDLPEKGTVNITSETFYLTANSGYSDLNGVYPIQVYANTVANARLLRVCQKYYVKSSLVDNGDGTYSLHNDGVAGHDIGLDFYAAGEVKKISGVYYVKSSLEDGQVVPTSIVVTQLTGVPNLQAWTVDKKIKHYCTAIIDFGKYLSGTFSVEVKFQGSSTLYFPKRNLRFTFYKNSSFAKKLKLKIGEMVRTSGYNLKAFYNDPTRIKEYILNRLFMAVWEKRPNADAVYPWNRNNSYYTDATGMIKSFPIKLSLGGVFYGFMIFGLKKDEKNYMLDGDNDASGIFVSGEAGNNRYNAKGWADELGVDGRELAYPELGDDSVSVETATAINNFFKYLVGEYKGTDDVVYGPSDVLRINGIYYVRDTLTYDSSTGTYSVNENSISTEHIEHFNKSDAYEHINILDWIDYLICIEVFYMSDNTIHNMILYTDKDKEKFSSFLYDVDSSFNFANLEGDVLSYWTPTNNIENDALWGVIFNNYKDDIHRRYKELRGSVLNVEYLTSLLEFIYGIIPAEWFTAEQNAWGSGNGKIDYTTLTLLEKRLKWMDKSFFNIRN